MPSRTIQGVAGSGTDGEGGEAAREAARRERKRHPAPIGALKLRRAERDAEHEEERRQVERRL